MRLVRCNMDEVRQCKGWYKKSPNYDIIQEFIESGMECAKIEGIIQKSAESCAGSLNQSIKRYSIGGIKAVSRKGNVYLVKIK